MLLDQQWLKENFIEGTTENTKEGDKVYVNGIDGVDEVLYEHTVHIFLGDFFCPQKTLSVIKLIIKLLFNLRGLFNV